MLLPRAALRTPGKFSFMIFWAICVCAGGGGKGGCVLGYQVAWNIKHGFLQREGGGRYCYRWSSEHVRLPILDLGTWRHSLQSRVFLFNEWEFQRLRRVESHCRQEFKATEVLKSMLHSRASKTNFKGREMTLKRQAEIAWLALGIGAYTYNPSSGELRWEDCWEFVASLG